MGTGRQRRYDTSQGLLRYVERPFDPEKLREQVGEWVRKARDPGAGQAA